MNCKPGDLAMIIKTEAGKQNGIVVRCLHLYTGLFNNGQYASSDRPWWVVDKELSYTTKSRRMIQTAMVPDCCLMPIKPLDDEPEELLTVCGCGTTKD
jgi:hypothetical protein